MTTTTIATTNRSYATRYNWQHKIDRCQNGVLWATFTSASVYQFWYSTDDGANWTEDVPARISAANYSSALFIDIDDYAHFSWAENLVIYYRRGTPNASRTAWTWSSTLTVDTQNSPGGTVDPTIVAHRQGTGWVCHVLYKARTSSAASAGQPYRTQHRFVTITAAGGISRSNDTSCGYIYTAGSPVDFNHTGDGKTVPSGENPDLYFASSGTSGTVPYVKWGKVTYSETGGVPDWDWLAPYDLNIVNNQYAYSGQQASFFDGTRSVVAYVPSNNTDAITVYDIDVATRATTLLPTPPYLISGTITNLAATYDEEQNIYLWASPTSTANGVYQTIYDRAAGTWGAWTLFQSTLVTASTVSIKRGWSGNTIEGVWTDVIGSSEFVKHANFALNSKPDAPTISLPTDNETVNLTSGVDFYYVYSDPDGNPQVGYALKRRLVTVTDGIVYGPDEWWDGAGWVASETVVASTAQPIATAWSVGKDTYQYSLATSDFGRLGYYSTYQTLNPFEWWDGTNWVPMVEGWIVSTASEVTLSGAQNNLEEGFDYDWSVATKDTWSWYGPYASMFTFIAGGGSLARIWNGSAWLDHEIFVRVTSSAWAKHSARVWDGAAWVTY